MNGHISHDDGRVPHDNLLQNVAESLNDQFMTMDA
jgi:hypothetical protein